MDTIVLCVLRVVTQELSRTLHLQLEEAEVNVEVKAEVEVEQKQGQGQGGRLEKEIEKEKEERQDVSCVLSPCYAILLTTAPLLLNIHPYVAERVVAAVTSLCSRMAIRSDVSSRRSISKNNSKDNGKEKSDSKEKVEDNTNNDKDESKNVNKSEDVKEDMKRDKDEDKLLTDEGDEDKDKVKDKDKDVETMGEALAVILHFINILIRPHTRLSNIRLLYALMHAGEEIIPALQECGIEHTVDPLVALLPVCAAGVPNRRPKELSLLVQSYLTRLEEKSREGEGATVQDATAGLSVLRSIINEETLSGRYVSHKCVGVSEGDEGGKEVKAVKEGGVEMKGGKGDNDDKGRIDAEKEENGEECNGEGEEEEEEMDSSMYRYEESPCPASFFLPAAWWYALHSSPDLCNVLPVHSITLLDPYTEGLIHDHDPTSSPSFAHSSTQPRDGDASHLRTTTADIDEFV